MAGGARSPFGAGMQRPAGSPVAIGTSGCTRGRMAESNLTPILCGFVAGGACVGFDPWMGLETLVAMAPGAPLLLTPFDQLVLEPGRLPRLHIVTSLTIVTDAGMQLTFGGCMTSCARLTGHRIVINLDTLPILCG